MRFSLRLLLVVAFLTLEGYLLARAGGGRNGGGGILGLILWPFIFIFGLYVNHRINKKKAASEALMYQIAKHDPAWGFDKLKPFVRERFVEIQQAWCDSDLGLLESRLSPILFRQWKSQIDDSQKRGDKNRMDGLTVNDIRFVTIRNLPGETNDSFTACIDAGATDYTIDKNGNIVDSNAPAGIFGRKTIEKKFVNFREFWTFKRKGHDEWILDQVDQAGAWHRLVDEENVDRE